ncbi:drug resistance transporter, EmrB/QacA subfamily [Actinacidiphila yanglinensis]|uniref:Drug resistance transporter, EmrB/QacA subfamily n=1 Tax=Actinacidiphila yanglinensis TaxID=310779 RepID=A0A1H6DY02_9ACTN|nr:DHA2 family efflux MFS transporter permease subunit [Actinacidiphila yanglinensis]SEG90121.1 drug resistance transporter, EmrB/QacA subfamily [Actinacidiphila yanglinensis]
MNKLRGNPWAILMVLSIGFFMTLLDLTIVNIAIPDMVDHLGASLDQILWITNAYTLALAVLMITAGRLGDLRGKKNLFIYGVALFTLASLACGLSQNPTELITFRAVQGLGAAMLLPQTLSLVVDVFPAGKRGAALGIWGVVAGVSGAAGPSVGGLLVTRLDWRWIFFVNVPLGVLAVVGAIVLVPAPRRTVAHRFDATGVLLSTVALFLLSFGLIEGQKYAWNGWIWAMIGGSAAVGAVFLLHQRGRQAGEPLVPFSLFADRNFSLMNVVGIAISFGLVGLFLPITVYLQSVLGFSALKAGVVLIALSIGTFATAGPASVLTARLGGRWILFTGLVLFGGGLVWIAAVAKVGGGWLPVAVPLVVMGMGAGCTFTPMANEVMRNVPPRLTGAASGVNNALRQVGSVLGAAVIGAVLQGRLASSLEDQAHRRAGAVPPAFRDRFEQGFDQAGKHLDVAGGSSGTKLPAGVPAAQAHRLQETADAVFGHAFIDAMRPTLLVAAGVLALGALSCLFVRRFEGESANPHGVPLSQEEVEAAEADGAGAAADGAAAAAPAQG